MNKWLIVVSILSILLTSCEEKTKELPIIGQHETLANGAIDYHTIPPFQFVNQLEDTITNASFSNKVYAADFFFTSCPSICPKVMKQMLRIADHTNKYNDFLLVSHTIDPKRDTPERLFRYADNLDIDHKKWQFLTGDKDELLDIAEEYYVAAYEDPEAPGGFDHSGKILLVDMDGHIRAFCDGTDADDVTEFMKDIDILMKQYAE
jgi:protein SCO1/2